MQVIERRSLNDHVWHCSCWTVHLGVITEPVVVSTRPHPHTGLLQQLSY